MEVDFKKEDVSRVECRFAVLCSPPKDENGRLISQDDYHAVKEIIHLKDGRKISNLRIIKNYKRPFWITKEAFRNHQDKKEWEHEKKLQKWMCTQSKLVSSIATALGTREPARGGLRAVCRSPYVYGADIKSTALIKREYLERFPGETTPFKLSCFDTETNVLSEDNEIIMATLSCQDKVYTAIAKSFLENVPNAVARLHELSKKYLGDIIEQRNIKWEFEIVESEIDIIYNTFKRAHQWKPDWLSIWNMDFDIPKILEALRRHGLDPKYVFSDPSIPENYKFFHYKQGQSQKVTASGKITPIKPAARWHTAFAPASFYIVDGMCAYRHIRNGQQEEPSYSLDSILQKHLGIRKLKFKEADHLEGFPWHVFMQTHYKLEYVIYNGFDCISMEMLDEVTKDLAFSMPLLSGSSDFEDFKSQPRRVVDELHFACQKSQDKVIGTTSDEMTDDFDDVTIGLDNWIIMLPAHLVASNGLKVIEECPDMATNFRRGTGDLDVAASYPNGEAVFNVSKETTAKELISIEGVDEYTQRMMGINMSAGHVNAVEICNNLFKMPPLFDLLDAFEEDIAAGAV